MTKPTKYSKTIADQVCRRLAAGESLREICKTPQMPEEATVRQWVVDDVDGFHERFTRARDLGFDCMADEVLEIADSDDKDARDRRIRLDARRWYLAKLAPTRYGEKTQMRIEHNERNPLKEIYEQIVAGNTANDERNKSE